MSHSLLIINAPAKSWLLADFFHALAGHYRLTMLTADSRLLKIYKQNNWPNKKILFAPISNRLLTVWLFILLYPGLLIYALILLIRFKNSAGQNTVCCFSWSDKCFITPMAKLLKFKVCWFENPDLDINSTSWLFKIIYKHCAQPTYFLTLTDYTKKSLINFGVQTRLIKALPPGLKLDRWRRQENIFTSLAHSERNKHYRKYFTLGTVIQPTDKQQLNTLFQAAAKCLNVIPNLQIIIIGGTAEKQKLVWLAKNMAIGNITWFIGPQQQLKKWLANLDIYIHTAPTLTLEHLQAIIEVAASNLPLIGTTQIGLEDFIKNNKNGRLIKTGSSDQLAQAIIELEQNRIWRQRLGENSKKLIAQNFTLENMIKHFQAITN